MGCCFASYILHLLSRRCFFHPQTQHFGCKSWRFWSQAWWISESRRVVTRRQAPRRLRRKEWMAQPSWNLSPHIGTLCQMVPWLWLSCIFFWILRQDEFFGNHSPEFYSNMSSTCPHSRINDTVMPAGGPDRYLSQKFPDEAATIWAKVNNSTLEYFEVFWSLEFRMPNMIFNT